MKNQSAVKNRLAGVSINLGMPPPNTKQLDDTRTKQMAQIIHQVFDQESVNDKLTALHSTSQTSQISDMIGRNQSLQTVFNQKLEGQNNFNFNTSRVPNTFKMLDRENSIYKTPAQIYSFMSRAPSVTQSVLDDGIARTPRQIYENFQTPFEFKNYVRQFQQSSSNLDDAGFGPAFNTRNKSTQSLASIVSRQNSLNEQPPQKTAPKTILGKRLYTFDEVTESPKQQKLQLIPEQSENPENQQFNSKPSLLGKKQSYSSTQEVSSSQQDKVVDTNIVRQRLQQDYESKAQEGRRMRKDKDQMSILVEEFNKNQKWSYNDKIRIGEQIGMTFHQVSKWNWDYRKKLGISTKRLPKNK